MTPRELPILFSGEMVRAILDGRKTQSRRVVTSHTSTMGSGRFEWLDLNEAVPQLLWGDMPGFKTPTSLAPPEHCPECWARVYPRWEVGDRLYVRETWRPVRHQGGTGMYSGTVSEQIEYQAHEGHLLHCKVTRACSGLSYVGEPDNYGRTFHGAKWWHDRDRGRWRPSIHMPKWASRIWLEVTDVRVERVQEIKNADYLSEGVQPHPPYGSPASYRTQFRELWDSINAKRAPWAENPWVWVVSFRRGDR